MVASELHYHKGVPYAPTLTTKYRDGFLLAGNLWFPTKEQPR